MSHAVDIFALLDKMSKKQHAYPQLTDEEQKSVSPLIVMRWLAGCNDQLQLIRLNEMANPFVFSLGQNKELLMALLTEATTGPKRYNWLKTKGSVKSSLRDEVIMQAFECSQREARLMPVCRDEVLAQAELLGWQKDEMTKLKKELADGSE
jgi:hypothetical protein